MKYRWKSTFIISLLSLVILLAGSTINMFCELNLQQINGEYIEEIVWGCPFFVVIMHLSEYPTYLHPVFSYNPLGAILNFLIVFLLLKLFDIIRLKLKKGKVRLKFTVDNSDILYYSKDKFREKEKIQFFLENLNNRT